MVYRYNTLAQGEIIPGAWEDWAEYRSRLTGEIISCLSLCEGKRVAIYGAGACNDIDIHRLLREGCDVTLFDRDLAAMEQAAEEKGYGQQISMKEIDFFRIEDREYEILEEILSRGGGREEIAGHLRDIWNREGEQELEVPTEQFDLNICIGVHSQILIRLVTLMQLYGCRDESGELHRLLCEMNQDMVERLHDAMLQKGSGLVLIGYEYGSFQPGQAEPVKRLFEQGQAAKAGDYGVKRVSGAYEAEQDISRRFHENELRIYKYWYDIWNFLPEKEYLMAFFCFTSLP